MQVNFSPSLIAMVEGVRRAPTLQFAQKCDEALGTPGTFARLQQFARKEALPAWFQPYADIEELVTARMARPVILDRPDRPLLWAVIDEGALHRRIGSEKIMRDQFFRLAEMAMRPNITIEVVPYSAGGHYALLGSLNIVESAGSAASGTSKPPPRDTSWRPLRPSRR